MRISAGADHSHTSISRHQQHPVACFRASPLLLATGAVYEDAVLTGTLPAGLEKRGACAAGVPPSGGLRQPLTDIHRT